MLDNFIFSINVVLPIFIVILLGYVLRVLNVFKVSDIKVFNKIVFTVALPLMLFKDISRSDFSNFFDVKMLTFALVTTFLSFSVAWLVAILIVKRESRGSFIQGCFRGNYAIIGLSLIANILGASNTGKGAIVTTFVIPIYNILSVVALSVYGSKKNQENIFVSSVKNIIKNPLIIGIVVAFPFTFFSIKLPDFVNMSVNYMSNLATPLALIAIGGSINPSDFLKSAGSSALASLLKLVIIPGVFVPFAVYFGLTGESLVVLFVMYSVPTAVSSFVMADAMGNDAPLAANIVLMTTIFSIFTFTIGIFIFKTLNLI